MVDEVKMSVIKTETAYPMVTVITIRDDHDNEQYYQFYDVNGSVDVCLWRHIDGTLVWWYEDHFNINREGLGILAQKYSSMDFYYDWLNYRYSDRYETDYTCGLV